MNPTNLLNDDGTASMATMIMTSHHAFRRDLARFAAALGSVPASALRDAWKKFAEHLHGHHEAEDAGLFPAAREQHPGLRAAIDELAAQHEQIAPLLERTAAAFQGLPGTLGEARAAVADATRLLDVHLDLEEATVIPTLRSAREFPPLPPEQLDLYAAGFAWSLHGLAPDVVAQILLMLPEGLRARLPAARALFDAECVQTFGATAQTPASRTSVPQ